MSRNHLIKGVYLAALLAILAIATNILLALHLSACHHEESSHQHDPDCQICKVLSLAAGHTVNLIPTILYTESPDFHRLQDLFFVRSQNISIAIIPRAPPVS